jgi:hypothetical protein
MNQYLLTINRIAVALLGGYAFTWGFTALGIAGLVALGVDFHEAETGILLLAFLIILAGGAATMLGTSLYLQSQLLG